MKKIVIVFTLLIGATTVSFAQAAKTAPATAPTTAAPAQRQPPTPEERAKMMTDRMDKMLTLTPDQKKSMTAVNTTLNTKMEAMRKDKTAGNSGDLKTYRDTEYKKILTPEQYAKFEASMKPRTAAPAPAPAVTPGK